MPAAYRGRMIYDHNTVECIRRYTMGLLDNVKDLGSKALEKGKEAADTAKTKLQITEAEGKIKEILLTVARDILANKPEILEENYAEQFGKIKEFQTKIEELKATLVK